MAPIKIDGIEECQKNSSYALRFWALVCVFCEHMENFVYSPRDVRSHNYFSVHTPTHTHTQTNTKYFSSIFVSLLETFTSLFTFSPKM